MKNLFNLADEFVNNEKIILRDYLALERTKLANERTLFSYIRTSLYLLTVGIGVFEIKSISHLTPIGWICIITGLFLLFTGIFRYCRMRLHLKKYFK